MSVHKEYLDKSYEKADVKSLLDFFSKIFPDVISLSYSSLRLQPGVTLCIQPYSMKDPKSGSTLKRIAVYGRNSDSDTPFIIMEFSRERFSGETGVDFRSKGIGSSVLPVSEINLFEEFNIKPGVLQYNKSDTVWRSVQAIHPYTSWRALRVGEVVGSEDQIDSLMNIINSNPDELLEKGLLFQVGNDNLIEKLEADPLGVFIPDFDRSILDFQETRNKW